MAILIKSHTRCGAVVAADGECWFFLPEKQGAGEQPPPSEGGRGVCPDEQRLDEGEACPAVPLVAGGDNHGVCLVWEWWFTDGGAGLVYV